MRNLSKLLLQLSVSIVFFGALTISASAQTTFTVNALTNESDETPADNICDTDLKTPGLQCTLRAAIEQANAIAGADNVVFDQAIFGAGGTIETNFEFDIADDINISQTGNALVTILNPNPGNDARRIFTIVAGADTTLTRIELTGGFSAASNTPAGGGAIYNSTATLILNQCFLHDNSSETDGGAIYNAGGTVNVNRSTLATNLSNNGGAIYNAGGTVNLTNSTLSGNAAGNIGGGYYGFASLGIANLTATNATVAFNSATNGGGIAVSSTIPLTSSAGLNNSIVSNNAGADLFNAAGNTFTSSGYNIVQNVGTATFLPAIGDQVATNPLLLPLALNGALTPTHGLLNGGFTDGGVSPAIDAGNTAQSTDQRGRVREVDIVGAPNAPGGDFSDIGAFEVQLVPTAASVSVSGRVLTNGGRGIFGAVVSLTDSQGLTRYAVTNPFGYYRFKDVQAGAAYTFAITGKRYSFAPQAVVINEETTDLNFTAK